MVEALQVHPADIWVLTETRDEVRPAVHMLPVHAAPRPNDSDRVKGDSRWVSIWSSLPIVEHVATQADPSRTVAARLRMPTGRALLVYGTVLPWNTDPIHRGAEKRALAVDGQITEWSQLRRHYESDLFVLAGDFNQDMGPGGPGSSKKVIKQLERAFEGLGVVCVTASFRAASQRWRHRRVDHIALSRELAVDSLIVHAWDADRRLLSDHSGVVVAVQD